MLPYADLAAFRELRKRVASGKLKSRIASSSNLVAPRVDSTAGKTVRLNIPNTDMEVDDDIHDDGLYFAEGTSAANRDSLPPLGLSRSNSLTNLPRSASHSQSTTPRHSLSISTPRAAQGLASAEKQPGLGSPISPTMASPSRPPTYALPRGDGLRMDDDDMLLINNSIRLGRPYREGNNVAFVCSAGTTADEGFSTASLPPGIRITSLEDSTIDFPNPWDDEHFMSMLTADPAILLTIVPPQTDASSSAPATIDSSDATHA